MVHKISLCFIELSLATEQQLDKRACAQGAPSSGSGLNSSLTLKGTITYDVPLSVDGKTPKAGIVPDLGITALYRIIGKIRQALKQNA